MRNFYYNSPQVEVQLRHVLHALEWKYANGCIDQDLIFCKLVQTDYKGGSVQLF